MCPGFQLHRAQFRGRLWVFLYRVRLAEMLLFSRPIGASPIGSTPLYQKQLGVFLQIFNILREKGEINFKIGGIG
jgi:hypothetical protein